jgi:tetratricopeptide (TPR) repeat protein
MPEDDAINAKAKLFFEKGAAAAVNNNFDYGINMFIEGLRCKPDALQDGHLPLRELALSRQVKGGKKPTMMERLKYLRGKTPLEQMLNAEYLFAKDPDHLPYAEHMLKAAVSGGYNQTAKWIADLLFAANNASQSPSVSTYLLLKDSYAAIGLWDRALAACKYAARIRPDDDEIGDEVQRLSAEMTVARGKYDQAGDFRKSIKDREMQEKLQSQQAVVKTEDYRRSAVELAREAYEEDPETALNIFGLAEALADLHTDQGEQEAIKLLEDAYRKRQDFSFRERAGLILISQIKRKMRETEAALENNPEDSTIKSRLAGLMAQLNKAEMEHYGLCVRNYPTDLKAKYEYGVRLVRNKRFDEAIPLFQDAQRDPRHKTAAMDKIGLCFFMKGWFADAVDIFTQAIDGYEIKDDDTAKELRYNLARSYEEQGEKPKALEIYRKLAQLDFGFKDVSQRVDKLRKEAK